MLVPGDTKVGKLYKVSGPGVWAYNGRVLVSLSPGELVLCFNVDDPCRFNVLYKDQPIWLGAVYNNLTFCMVYNLEEV